MSSHKISQDLEVKEAIDSKQVNKMLNEKIKFKKQVLKKEIKDAQELLRAPKFPL